MSSRTFKTTEQGMLPAETDVDVVLADGDEKALFALWSTYQHNLFTRNALGEHAEVTPQQALAASRRLINHLVEWRWVVIQHARQAGDGWPSIGAALNMTAQEAADWYQRKSESPDPDKAIEIPDAARAWHPYG